MTRAVVFDLDDTLYAYDSFVDSGFHAVGDYLARVWRVDATGVAARLRAARREGARGRELQDLCDAYGWSTALVPRLVDVMRFHRPVVELRPGAVRVLESLRRDGWRLGVLTNGHPGVQAAKVKALGVAPLVDCVTYAEACVPGGKPSREAFEAVVARLGVAAHRAVMVGDDLVRDVRGARDAGLHAIHVSVDPGHGADGRGYAVAASLPEAGAVAARLIPVHGAEGGAGV